MPISIFNGIEREWGKKVKRIWRLNFVKKDIEHAHATIEACTAC